METWEKTSKALNVYQWTSNLIRPAKFSCFDKGQKCLFGILETLYIVSLYFFYERREETAVSRKV